MSASLCLPFRVTYLWAKINDRNATVITAAVDLRRTEQLPCCPAQVREKEGIQIF